MTKTTANVHVDIEPAMKKLKVKANGVGKHIEEIAAEECPLNLETHKTLFASLIRNSLLTPEAFFSGKWEKEAVLMKNNSEGGADFSKYFSKLFSFEVLQKVIERFSLKEETDISASKVIEGNTFVHDNLKINNKGLTTAFNEGFTVAFYQPQKYCDELWKIVERLESYFGCLVSCQANISPENSQPQAPRHDDTEGFILQLGGGMKLSLYEEICQLPLEGSDDLCAVEDELNLQREFQMQTGDVLYLPRGKVYQTTAGANGSTYIHLRAFKNVTWGGYLSEMIPELISQLTSDEMFLRQNLPVQRFKGHSDRSDFVETLLSKFDRAVSLARGKLEQSKGEVPFVETTKEFMARRLPPQPVTPESCACEDCNSEEIQVRFIYPEHVMIMKCDDPEEEEEDDDDKVCVYYSSSNHRNHHFSQLDDEPVLNRVLYPLKYMAALKRIHNGINLNALCYTKLSEIPLNEDEAHHLCSDLVEKGLLEYH